MPSLTWTLYRLILIDLLRLIGLTAAVLVTVIAFGATIKPLSSDMLLDAPQTLKYLGLVMVPMLQFALPFAAGFGATLAMHRMTADNEIQAMAASGISYRRILLPILALGLSLTIIMVALTQTVIPRFWGLLEQAFASDMTKLFQASLQRGEAFQYKDELQIYADHAVITANPEGSEWREGGEGGGPTTRMHLLNVAAAELDKDGRIITDVTANHALLDVYRREGQTVLKLAITDAVRFDASDGDLAYASRILPGPLVIPSSIRENPKAMTRAQLLALRQRPDDFAEVASAKRALAQVMRDVEMRSFLDGMLRRTGQVELRSEGDGEIDRRFVVSAARLIESQSQFKAREGGMVEIVQIDAGQPVRRFTTARAQLEPAGSGALGTPLFDVQLAEHQVTDLRPGAGGGAVNQRQRLALRNLSIGDSVAEDLAELEAAELIARANAMRQAPRLSSKIEDLKEHLVDLDRAITSRLLARYALSITALLLLVIGALLAMLLRGSLPLTIYLWAFLPAILSLVVISAGDQLMRNGNIIAGPVMWSGNALLLALCIGAYLRLMRN